MNIEITPNTGKLVEHDGKVFSAMMIDTETDQPKRQKVFVNIAVRYFGMIAKEVNAMPQEMVDQLLAGIELKTNLENELN